MAFRVVAAAALTFVSISYSQTLPSYQWIREVDASGMDSVAGLGSDAQGNIYVAGSTSSRNFPVKNAVQPNTASSGLYRISATTTTPLGLSSCNALAVDPQNPSMIFAASNGALLESVNGGATFTPTTLPSSQASSIAFQPGNDQVLFAGTGDQGVLRSGDGGTTWSAMNNGLPVQKDGQIPILNLWIDPANVDVIFAESGNGLARSGDGGANWQATTIAFNLQSLTFDTNNAGVLYVSPFHGSLMRSADHGQTFQAFTVPSGVAEVFPDPIQPGRLIGAGTGLYQSTDNGVTWTQESNTSVSPNLVADRVNGVYYAANFADNTLLRIQGNLQNASPIGPPATANVTALAIVNGQVYAANAGSADVFITKVDSSGNILYSTYVGGTGNDQATAMTVDAQGSVFVTGTTRSADFPVSKGAYASSGTAFLVRLNPDGSLAYSTYFTGTVPVAVATDGSGSAWLLGNSYGGLPATPGALATTFCCPPLGGIFVGPPLVPVEATLTRFSPLGSSLTFSTYVPGLSSDDGLIIPTVGAALALAPDGSAYTGGLAGIFRIDSAGTTVLSSVTRLPVAVQAMAPGPDGSLYAAGTPANFQSTPGAFQSTLPPIPNLPSQTEASSETGILRIDPALQNILAASYFGTSAQVRTMTTDAVGNLYIGGATGPTGLPTRTPLNGGFASPTGFMSELSGDLSALLFSSYFGDAENFVVSGLALGQNGSVVIGGATKQSSSFPPNSGDVWLNSLALTPPPPSRIDSVENAASFVDGPVAGGETIVVNGAGFGNDAQLSIGGVAVSPMTITPTAITAIVPEGVPAAAAAVEVQSAGSSTNSVLMPVAATAPGIFSQNGSGYGQGYILNQNGTLNSPSNPAAPGDRITLFATGVGPMTFTPCCAVAQYPVNVFIDGIYCDGVAAIAGQVNGLPGNVYQITVYVPNPAVLFANSKTPFVFPPLDGVIMQVNGVYSQPGIAVSIAQ